MSDKKETFIVLDDDDYVLAAFNSLFHNEKYNLFTTKSISEAFEFLKYNDVQLFISDQWMPEKNGIEVLEEIRNLYPDIVRVIISGRSDIPDLIDAVNKSGIYRFIKKPWDQEELKLNVRQCFSHYNKLINHKNLFEKLAKENDILKKLTLDNETANKTQAFNVNLCKEILSRIPIPLILLDENKNIIFINEKAIGLKVFSDNCLYKNIKDFMPINFIEYLEKMYENPDIKNIKKYVIENKEYVFHFKCFFPETKLSKNCIVLFSDKKLLNFSYIFEE